VRTSFADIFIQSSTSLEISSHCFRQAVELHLTYAARRSHGRCSFCRMHTGDCRDMVRALQDWAVWIILAARVKKVIHKTAVFESCSTAAVHAYRSLTFATIRQRPGPGHGRSLCPDTCAVPTARLTTVVLKHRMSDSRTPRAERNTLMSDRGETAPSANDGRAQSTLPKHKSDIPSNCVKPHCRQGQSRLVARAVTTPKASKTLGQVHATST
jgi:hypothetical protein